jgi:uncharacterized iron-regulated membrane protein
MAMNPDDFDTRVREAHATSLGRLSPRTQTQLRRRQQAAHSVGPAMRTPPLLRLALAGLAVCALAIGITRILPENSAAPPLGVVQQQPPPPTDTLDESPDFYVWLASDDASALAVE